MSNIADLRAGIIGTGFIGPVHLEALRRLGVQVTALCDLPSRVEGAARKMGIPSVYGDYRELLRATDVDVVHITAPNRFHCEMALAVLKAGKHCVCEKPLAMNTAETAKIVKAARAAGRVFAVNYNVRFYPAVLALREIVKRGELGEVIHVNGSYFQDWLFKDTDYNWRLLPNEGGKLRAVADIGTHWMDTASFVLGSPIRSVFADLGTWHKKRRRPLGEVQTFTSDAEKPARYATYAVKTEDYASVLLEFAVGAKGNVGVSQVAAGRKNCIRLEIYGSKKSAWWCSENPEVLHFGNRDSANETAVRGTSTFSGASGLMDYPAGHVEGFPDTFKMLFRSVYSHIASEKGNPLFAGALDGHHEVAICEAILASHQNRAWQKVP